MYLKVDLLLKELQFSLSLMLFSQKNFMIYVWNGSKYAPELQR